MTVPDVVNGPFGTPPHYWAYWGHVPSFLELLFLPALVAACALALSIGRAAAAGLRRWREPPRQLTPVPVDPPRPVLASDPEREAAVRSVTDAVGEARLSLDEGTAQIDAIWHARHRHELARFVADLPAPPPPASPSRGRVALGAAVALAAIAALVQGVFGLWELWPAAVVISLVTTLARR